MPTVKIPPVLRSKTGGEAEVSADGGTVGEALSALAESHPETREQLFGEDGELNRYVNVYLNDEDVRVLDGLETPASDSDTVVILPAMAGGEDEGEGSDDGDGDGGEPEGEQDALDEEDLGGPLPGVPKEAPEKLGTEQPDDLI